MKSGNFDFCKIAYPFILPDLRERMELIFEIQKRYAFRISEILALSSENLYPNFEICLKLSKCNDYYFFRDEEIYNRLKYFFDKTPSKNLAISYKMYYKYFRRYHSQDIIQPLNKSAKVTHAFRYVRAKAIRKKNTDPKIIQASLRHKSVVSQSYYLKDVKTK